MGRKIGSIMQKASTTFFYFFILLGFLSAHGQVSFEAKASKNKLGLKYLRHSNKLNKKISKVSVVVGSRSFAIKDSIESNVDAFITSDFKYHNFFEADNKAILIDIGHYESEKHIKLFIKEFLNKKLPNFTVLLSEQNINPVNYY